MKPLESAFLEALHDDPADEATWQALADWLEEDGQAARAAVVRLWRGLRPPAPDPRRAGREKELRRLLQLGEAPCVPRLEVSLGITLALVPAGSFLMGSPRRERERLGDEGPQHEVEITRPFWVGVTTVTQAQYRELVGVNPSHHAATGEGAAQVAGLDTDDFPVEMVSWEEAAAFCDRLSGLPEEKVAGRVYRLPTEAEWEYACREAGACTAPFHYGQTIGERLANHDATYQPYRRRQRRGSCLGRPAPVGGYPPSALGLFDLHGNVWEWCVDWYASDYYRKSPRRDPPGPPRGTGRVLRGGCWTSYARDCRCARRYQSRDGYRVNCCFGFRVVMTRPGS
jgi:uncharacterized protein (TIGR02996 family)